MVLKPLNKKMMNSIFDDTAIKVINYFLKKSLFSQPELLKNQDRISVQIPKEHIEQWIAQAIDATPVGSGSYPVDIIKKNKFGADIKMLSCKVSHGKLRDSESGETSLAQKFKDSGKNLDNLFLDKEYNKILDSWCLILKNKLNKVFLNDKVKKIYYFFVLRADKTFYLSGLEVNVDKIINTKVDILRTSNTSVYTKGFIDDKYGSVKIYKSKKRMELRLKPKQWLDDNLLIEFPIKFENKNISIRDLIESNSLEKHIRNLIKEIL